MTEIKEAKANLMNNAETLAQEALGQELVGKMKTPLEKLWDEIAGLVSPEEGAKILSQRIEEIASADPRIEEICEIIYNGLEIETMTTVDSVCGIFGIQLKIIQEP